MDDNTREVYEELIALYSTSALPQGAAKVISWLTVCEPQEQTAADIRKATGVSAGALSEAMTMFVKVGMVTRTRKPGSRKHYYKNTKDNVLQTIRRSVESTKLYTAAAESGLKKLPNNDRLKAMRDLYGFLDARFTEIIDEFENKLSRKTER
ncbi:MAG: hypothetical protein QM571_06500 [Micrococcaceae bacterium]